MVTSTTTPNYWKEEAMKNKIIAGTIAVLFLPASVAFFGLLNEYFLFRVIFITVLWIALMISIYKLVKYEIDIYYKRDDN